MSDMMQSFGRQGSISSKAGIVYFTVTALITNSGLKSLISSSVWKRWQLYVEAKTLRVFLVYSDFVVETEQVDEE